MKTDLAAIIQCLDRQMLKYNIIQHGKAAALVLPGYGRLLGFWSDVEKDNHFWLNRDFLKGHLDPNWVNPGGHRIWLAPEREFFISDLKYPFETYQVPAAIDPGSYKCTCDKLSLQLSNAGILRSFARQINCSFSLTRIVSLLDDDKLAKFAAGRQIQIAGYEDSVELTAEGCPAGIWSLIQVPLEGVISLPVFQPANHKVFFGGQGSLVEYNNGLMNLRLAPAPKQEFKIGIKASMCKNVITYLKTYKDGLAILVIKEFEHGPDSAYLDTPWNEPDDKGYAVQFFCGGIHGFGELEVHAPVLEVQGSYRSKFKMIVRAISGPVKLCLQCRQIFLGTTHEMRSEFNI